MNIFPEDARLRLWRQLPLILTAGFALTWIVHRAKVQSITLDEVDTFNYWATPATPTHWEPHSNNHVLNSTLMRLSIWLFGRSELAARAPALLGGFLYVLAIFHLSRLLASGRLLSWALFVCFVYNPFIMDYLIAARGYGLALGSLGWTIYFLARGLILSGNEMSERAVLNYTMAISACAALSICSNFSFAYASSFLLLIASSLAGVWMIRQHQQDRALTTLAGLIRLAAACSFPALIVLVVLAGSALTRFPREQLFWGVDSLSETWGDIQEASFGGLNPFLVNPLLMGFLETFQRHLFQALAGFGIVFMVLQLAMRRKPWDAEARPRLLLAAALALTFALTVLAHWLQLKLLKIPLPFERTSIFFVPLATAGVGALVSVAPVDRLARLVQGFGLAVLLTTGVYFIGELRDSYFREWRFCSEVKVAFPVIVELCRRTGVREITSDAYLRSTLNFYREMYQANDIDEVPAVDKAPPGKKFYVLPGSSYGDFIRTEGLQVIWHGSVSDLVVAVRPETRAQK